MEVDHDSIVKVEFPWNNSANFSNFMSKEFDNKNYIFDQPLNAILICTYIPLFLIALMSNILIILVVGRYRCLRSVTNYFIVNLSIADLLVTLICMPVAVGQSITHLWLYGEALCKLTHYLQGVAVSASVFTITVMSIDRYLAIRHPMSRKIINRRTTRKIILCLWSLSLLIFSPILYIRRMRKHSFIIVEHVYEETYCVEAWPTNLSRKTFGAFCFVVVYAIPGIIVIFAYSLMGLRLRSRHLLPEYQIAQCMSSPGTANSLPQLDSSNSAWQVSSASGRLVRERRRVAKILLILALVFATCWLPYSVLSLILDIKSETQMSDEIVLVLPFAILLGHVNSAVNPLLYCLLSKNFRRSVTELFWHPTRIFRSRQPHKIRMTFRKDPPVATPKNVSKEQVSNHHRPRNHHTPDPSEGHSATSSQHGVKENIHANRGIPATARLTPDMYLVDQAEFCVLDKKRVNNKEVLGWHSPCSSGYSSMRHSLDALTMAVVNKEGNSLCQCSHFSIRKGDKNCHYCSNWNSSACLAVEQTQTNVLTSKRKLTDSVALKWLHLPSTISEESHSIQKSRSKLSFRNTIQETAVC